MCAAAACIYLAYIYRAEDPRGIEAGQGDATQGPSFCPIWPWPSACSVGRCHWWQRYRDRVGPQRGRETPAFATQRYSAIEATWCDIFPNVPPDVYKEKVVVGLEGAVRVQGHTDRCVTEVDIFVRLGKEIAGDVPLKVINDGEATWPSTGPTGAGRQCRDT